MSELDAWVETTLARLGTPLTGPVAEVRARPWGRMFRAPTADATLWVKQNRGGTTYEPALLELLSSIGDGAHVLRPLAIDAGRGWSVQRDGGPTLREALEGASEPGGWEPALARYAELQRASATQLDAMLAAGVPDQRPQTMAKQLLVLLDRSELTEDARTRLLDLLPDYAIWCVELAASGIGSTVQHDDLHSGNILATGHIFDWGDAAVMHPFCSMLVTLRSVASEYALAGDAPNLLRLRDAYLEPWTAEHSRDVLLEQVRLAVEVAKVSRALAWQRALVEATPADYATFGDPVADWLTELLGG